MLLGEVQSGTIHVQIVHCYCLYEEVQDLGVVTEYSEMEKRLREKSYNTLSYYGVITSTSV